MTSKWKRGRPLGVRAEKGEDKQENGGDLAQATQVTRETLPDGSPSLQDPIVHLIRESN